jgi:formylglycine-generating enzyme
MPARATLTRVVASLVWVLLLAVNAMAVSIETVPVGYAGNAADVDYGEGQFGAVAYDYQIGKYEVTNAQFVEFLNAKGGVGFAGPMEAAQSLRGGIVLSGQPGSFTYSVAANFADKPIIGVSALTAIRFANWMHNGQGNGDTETGAYTIPANLTDQTAIPRNPGARWFLPSENEWYKAAYYQPAAQGGDADDYWLYATRSNDAPDAATADAVGNISNSGSNLANYAQWANWNGTTSGNVTTVGSAGPASAGFFGTYDQAGNVYEWTEGRHPLFGDSQVRRGGSWAFGVGAASDQDYGTWQTTQQWYGFRLATVPEPSTYVLAALGFAAVLLARRRTRSALFASHWPLPYFPSIRATSSSADGRAINRFGRCSQVTLPLPSSRTIVGAAASLPLGAPTNERRLGQLRYQTTYRHIPIKLPAATAAMTRIGRTSSSRNASVSAAVLIANVSAIASPKVCQMMRPIRPV